LQQDRMISSTWWQSMQCMMYTADELNGLSKTSIEEVFC